MASVTFDNGRTVSDYGDPYVVAELNTSHFGDLATARAMIAKAQEVGCDCVKFQSWSAESLYASSFYRQPGNAVARRFVEKFALTDEEFVELAAFARDIGIHFASTPYSPREADFLVEKCGVPFIKIASMELNNLAYLSFLGRLGVPLVLSTGMGSLEEIVRAVKTVEDAGALRIIILHCNSTYPVPPDQIRLNNILGLRSEFPHRPIGYSDHSLGDEVAVAAVALGACLIEKHFTLDSRRIGMDNHMATEPDEMSGLVQKCRRIQSAMGGAGRMVSSTEREQASKMRRSLIAVRPLRAGHILEVSDLDAKRPGTGIAPCDIQSVVGRRLLVDLEQEATLQAWHIESSD